jgi:hypothetical protein
MPEKMGNGGNGLEKYDPDTGKYTYDEETLKKIDKNFSVPFCKQKVLPLLISKLKELNPDNYIKDVYEMEEYTIEEKKELDKQGVDFVMEIDGKQVCIDLKTVFPYDGEISEDINLSLFGYDENVNTDTNGYFLRKNMTDYYMFVLPKKILNDDKVYNSEEHEDIEFESFMVSKGNLMDLLAENFLRTEENQTVSSRSLIKKQSNKIIKAYHKVVEEYQKNGNSVNIIGDYDVYYYDDGGIKEIYKTFLGKNKRLMDIVLKIKNHKGIPRKSVLFQLDKKTLTKSKKSILIEKMSLENDIIKKFFNI